MLTILQGDWIERLRELPNESVQCCVTSPPYWGLRDYGVEGQLGLEKTPDEYVAKVVEGFREVRRSLRSDGTCWVNLGDSYAAGGRGGGSGSIQQNAMGRNMYETAGFKYAPDGYKPKDIVGVPWMVAFALRADGWYLRSAIIWAKPNGMPGSQEDRCTSSYEMVFLLSKCRHYFSDFDAIKTPPRESSQIRTTQDVQAQAGSHRANGGAKTNGPMKTVGVGVDKQRGHSRRHAGFNARWDAMEKAEQQSKPAMMRDVWFISPATYSEAHFATMPAELARRCILAGSRPGDTVLDPFGGSGTTGMVSLELGRKAVLIELNPAYVKLIEQRCNVTPGLALA